jgi:protein gp37
MAENSGIEWTDHTFNPWWGCSEVSPGCDHCYARTLAKRLHPDLDLWGPKSQRLMFEPRHWNEPLGWNRKAEKAGRRDRVFCASMADVFDNQVDLDDERADLWTLMHKTPHLDWLLLTKRVANVARMVPPSWMKGHWPKHVRLGISVVNQTEADRDIPKLTDLPSSNFLSLEPLLDPVDLRDWLAIEPDRNWSWRRKSKFFEDPSIDWVIVGGESGPGARPMHPDWVRNLRDQCQAAGVPFLFKQWGEWAPGESVERRTGTVDGAWWVDGRWMPSRENLACDEALRDDEPDLYRIGKKTAGRQLDGRTWDEVPPT